MAADRERRRVGPDKGVLLHWVRPSGFGLWPSLKLKPSQLPEKLMDKLVVGLETWKYLGAGFRPAAGGRCPLRRA